MMKRYIYEITHKNESYMGNITSYVTRLETTVAIESKKEKSQVEKYLCNVLEMKSVHVEKALRIKREVV